MKGLAELRSNNKVGKVDLGETGELLCSAGNEQRVKPHDGLAEGVKGVVGLCRSHPQTA